MRLLLVAALALAPLVAGSDPSAPTAADGVWRGTFSLPRPLSISVVLKRGTATVSLPAGHPAPSTVRAHVSGTRVRFLLAGRPGPLVFDGRVRNGRFAGSVAQAGLEGSFALRRGAALTTGDLGVYDVGGQTPIAVVQPGNRRLLIDYDAASIHGLFASAGGGFTVGAGLGVRDPAFGTARFANRSLALAVADGDRRARRRAAVEQEVRFRSGAALLAGTLAIPATPGRHPGVVLVQGSGPTPRTDAAVYGAYFLSRGFAVLAYDKRGIAQSGGSYPGEEASTANIDRYAADADAAVGFLAAQPEVDRARVGLAGASQAGWIMPVAASREPAVRFVVAISGPTVTEGEQRTYATLTTAGASTPSQSAADIIAAVRAGGQSGFDPIPAIRKLAVPALWIYGAVDQHVPSELCVERLAPIAAAGVHDFEYIVFPGADHFLIESAHGLATEDLRSSSYAPVFTAIDAWLAARGL